jgi:hypothetical protein
MRLKRDLLFSPCSKNNARCDEREEIAARSLLCLKESAHPGPAVSGKFEQKFFLMAPMGYAPGVSGQEVSFGPGHI